LVLIDTSFPYMRTFQVNSLSQDKTLRHLAPYSNQIGCVGLNSFSAMAETVCKRSQLNILSLHLDLK